MRRPHAWLLSLVTAGCTAAAPTRPAPAPAPPPPPSAGSPATPAPVATVPTPASPPDAAYAGHEDLEEPDDDTDDFGEAPEPAPTPRGPHPLDGLSKAQIAHLYADDPKSIGSVSLGRPSAGALVNGVPMPRGEGWKLIDPGHAYGTQETVDYLTAAIRRVRARYPDAHDVYIGHISAPKGGALRPHMSHQSGRDVDLSYFYLDDSARWYRRADENNLDRERTWAFVRALVIDTDPELILIDRSLQLLLKEHALGIGEDPEWIRSLFDGIPGKVRPLIFHAKGHATHLHVRFFAPVSQETARLAYDLFQARGFASGATAFVSHRVRKGETLGMIARKYGTTVTEIRHANGLRSNRIREKQVYKIPKRGSIGRPAPFSVPARRLPPPSGRHAERVPG